MASTVRRWLPLLLIVAGALGLRLAGLGDRPMHADEANQALKFGELLEHGNYAFDARDHHGPTLYFSALVPAWVRGERTLANLTETTLRLTPVFFGVAGVLLLAGLMIPLGRPVAWVAAALVVVSPPAVYYSRYFIQETLLVAFTLAVWFCASRWWNTRRDVWALLAGVAAGLMQATKATAPVFLLVAALAAAVTWPRFWVAPGLRRAGGLAAGAALAVVVVFYTSFGTHWRGLADALATYETMLPRAAGGSGHDKPWDYYLSLFLFRREHGLVWDQSSFLFLAGAGAIFAWRRGRRAEDGIHRFAALYALVLATLLSLTPYKTPWVVINLIPGLAMLAASAIGALAAQPHWGRLGAVALIVVGLGWQGWQTRQAVFLKPTDPSNPYAYAHSSPDVRRIGPTVAALSPEETVKVIGPDYWPLPWYLRSHVRTGYWTSAPEDCDGALVICAMEMADTVRARQRGRYREDFLGLRPGVILVVFTAKPPE